MAVMALPADAHLLVQRRSAWVKRGGSGDPQLSPSLFLLSWAPLFHVTVKWLERERERERSAASLLHISIPLPSRPYSPPNKNELMIMHFNTPKKKKKQQSLAAAFLPTATNTTTTMASPSKQQQKKKRRGGEKVQTTDAKSYLLSTPSPVRFFLRIYSLQDVYPISPRCHLKKKKLQIAREGTEEGGGGIFPECSSTYS